MAVDRRKRRSAYQESSHEPVVIHEALGSGELNIVEFPLDKVNIDISQNAQAVPEETKSAIVVAGGTVDEDGVARGIVYERISLEQSKEARTRLGRGETARRVLDVAEALVNPTRGSIDEVRVMMRPVVVPASIGETQEGDVEVDVGGGAASILEVSEFGGSPAGRAVEPDGLAVGVRRV